MKLSTVRIQQTLDQLDQPAVVVPETHPHAGQFSGFFGEHTFFLDEDGLQIVEPLDPAAAGEAGQVIRVAMWNDPGRTTLAAMPAEATGVVVTFPTPESHPVDRAVADSFPASDATAHSGITGPDDV